MLRSNLRRRHVTPSSPSPPSPLPSSPPSPSPPSPEEPSPPRHSHPLLPIAAAIVLAYAAGVLSGASAAMLGMFTHDHPSLDAAAAFLMRRLDLVAEITLPDPPEAIITSCSPSQPLVARHDSVLPPPVFAAVRACLKDHPYIAANELNPDGFNGTRGFVINFSADGVDTFLDEEKFACAGFNPLRPFFEAARHDATNAFVMNVLVCDKPTDKTKLSVGEHIDDTVAHNKPNTSFFAHTVSVMYITIPHDMTGGELELLGTQEEAYPDGEHDAEAPVMEKIEPKENLWAEFRGDSLHRVRAYETETDDLRVSLVLEQYKIPKEDEHFLVKYDHKQKNGMTMM